MVSMSKSHSARRAVNFDLNIEALRENYSVTNPKGAYREIRSFLEKNGFFHRQGSGYCSKDKITDAELVKVMTEMFKTFPWLENCTKKIDATDIGRIYDIKELFGREKTEGVFQHREESPHKASVLQKLNHNKEVMKGRGEIEKSSQREKGGESRDTR
ncbi:MAG: VapD family protein [Lachnospiraceae bacterium]